VTTRNGGASTGASASLDLGGSTLPSAPDKTAAVLENRRRVQAFLPSPPVWLAQVHGADVATVATTAPPSPPRADAATTRDPNVVLAARVADCMPVLFADRDASVVAVAHAGWRGLAAGVLENTIAAMHCCPARIVAWLGPAIGRRAFEVGADVYDAFVGLDASARTAFAPRSPGKWLADLEALVRMRLAHVGVHAIDGGGLCTFDDRARFFSYRRDGTSGRMAAFVWREGADR
jgi:YfiH family protein